MVANGLALMSAPWMPLYIADYLADTGHLSAAEHGAYLMLIMHYWRQGSLPVEDRTLQRISRMTPQEWSRSKAIIKAFFAEGWKHARIESELANSKKVSAARAEAGRAGGEAKSLRTKDAPLANAIDLPEQTCGKAVAISQSQSLERIEATPLVDAEPSTPPVRKKIDRTETDQELLDRITDRWNAWATSHGSPLVVRLTAKRGAHCRRRIGDLMQFGHETPEAAFDWLLSKVDQSFFARGSPRKPLDFDQLMRDEFMTKMVEGSFEFKHISSGNRKWAS